MKVCRTCNKEKSDTDFYCKGIRLDGRPKLSFRCKSCESDYKKSIHNPLQKWIKDLKNKFGISPFQYYHMLDSQGGQCAICGTSDFSFSNGGKPHVDHDHHTGEVRGLLCGRCNVALGHFQDDPDTISKAINYLNFWKTQTHT